MKLQALFSCFFVFLFLSVACTTKQIPISSTQILDDDQLALQTLTDFLDALHTGNYEKAASEHMRP
jgi:hypothetical protein